MHDEGSCVPSRAAEPEPGPWLCGQVSNPLRSITAEGANQDVPTDASCREGTASEPPSLAPSSLENDEAGGRDPRGTEANAHHGFENAVSTQPEHFRFEVGPRLRADSTGTRWTNASSRSRMHSEEERETHRCNRCPRTKALTTCPAVHGSIEIYRI